MIQSGVRSRLVGGSAWALGGRIVAAFAVLAVNALMARLLDPQQFGAYLLVANLVLFGATLAQLGLRQTMVRLVAESLGRSAPARARSVIRISFGLAALGAATTAAALAIAGHWLARSVFHSTIVGGVVWLAVAWLIVSTFQTLLSDLFRGFQDFRLASLFETLAANALLAAVLAIVWVFRGRASLPQVVALSVAAAGIAVLIAGILARPRVRLLPAEGGSMSVGQVMTIAWPLLITGLTLFLLGSGVDVLILGAFRSQQDVALYGAAIRLLLLAVTPLNILNYVVSPIVAERHGRDRPEDIQSLLRASATAAAVPSLVVLAVCIFAGGPVLSLVYGPFYRGAATVLAILSAGHAVNVCAGSCGTVLMMTGNQRSAMAITLVAGLLSVAGNVALVIPFGAVGIAISTAVATVLQNVLMVWSVRRRLGVWTTVESPAKALRQLRAGGV